MKYCVHFTKDFRYLDKIDEIMLVYNEYNENLSKVVQKYRENQRIIIDIRNLDDIESNYGVFERTIQAHSNIAFLIGRYSSFKDWCITLKVDFFYQTHLDTPDMVNQAIQEGVSDIYLTDELAFKFKSYQKLCAEHNVNIRIFPNVAQSSARKYNSETVTKFFIRPEDISYYDYDNVIFEFFGELDRQSVYYDIYTSRKWNGTIGQLIIGLDNLDTDNRTIAPIFGSNRLNCGKVCSYSNDCALCNRVLDTAAALENAKIGFKKEE